MGNKIFEFEIGKTMEETAAQTRLPLSGQNTNGTITAGSPIFPDGVYGRYAQKGFEIKVGPLSWINFFSDTKRHPNKLTESASMAVDARQGLTTHAQAYDYVYALINQFQRSKWQRYIPEECPRLTGKASILDPNEIEALATPELKNWIGFDCSADPEYKPPLDEWKRLTKQVITYRWHDGAGRIAKLVVSTSDGNPDGTLGLGDVQIDLEFELEESIKYRAAGNREAELKEPWGARVPKVEAEKLRIRDILERRAGKPREIPGPTGQALRAKAGQPCPRAGMWQSQDAKAEKRFYKEGDLMADLHSEYGMTIWQWVK